MVRSGVQSRKSGDEDVVQEGAQSPPAAEEGAEFSKRFRAVGNEIRRRLLAEQGAERRNAPLHDRAALGDRRDARSRTALVDQRLREAREVVLGAQSRGRRLLRRGLVRTKRALAVEDGLDGLLKRVVQFGARGHFKRVVEVFDALPFERRAEARVIAVQVVHAREIGKDEGLVAFQIRLPALRREIGAAVDVPAPRPLLVRREVVVGPLLEAEGLGQG